MAEHERDGGSHWNHMVGEEAVSGKSRTGVLGKRTEVQPGVKKSVLGFRNKYLL